MLFHCLPLYVYYYVHRRLLYTNSFCLIFVHYPVVDSVLPYSGSRLLQLVFNFIFLSPTCVSRLLFRVSVFFYILIVNLCVCVIVYWHIKLVSCTSKILVTCEFLLYTLDVCTSLLLPWYIACNAVVL